MKRTGHQCECAACLSGQDHPERAAHAALNVLMEQLDERQRRLCAATEAKRRGWGGRRQVMQITGISHTALRRGMKELDKGVPSLPRGRVRAAGAGRKRIEVKQPGIREALEGLVEAETAGDPEGQGKWVRSSLRNLRDQLVAQDYTACHMTVGRMLRSMKYRLRVNAKRKTGPSHPDRDRQFRHIQAQVEACRVEGNPVISVDTKKKSSSATSGTPAAPGGANPMP